MSLIFEMSFKLNATLSMLSEGKSMSRVLQVRLVTLGMLLTMFCLQVYHV